MTDPDSAFQKELDRQMKLLEAEISTDFQAEVDQLLDDLFDS